MEAITLNCFLLNMHGNRSLKKSFGERIGDNHVLSPFLEV